ncbi:GNAT family N-acetyltransferase [Roseomonas sp. M0104]|uniref:GNAT family N-acetyltransferase n=1 Tax=Teichococcus coralli TaxID=2545983 RepID=A0A845B3N5_9PROT|nr:GNAT family N-acetyltransferase [Pseudoroseomonas coralli]MXP61811.1 GNAT family N-acetyltransferase [Pseudoroseomonas coralli]
MTPTIRPARRAEMGLLADWAANEGWNPGLHDADTFFAADPEGFLLAEAGGEAAGCISAVRQGSGHGFIGFYIVRPDWRGKGVGLALWRAGMARLAGRVVGLDGVVAQQASYARSGFVLAWRNLRFAAAAPVRLGGGEGEVLPAGNVPFQDVAALDAGVFPAEREAFLRAWMAAPGHCALAVRGAGGLRGFGVARPCREGTKLGPLTATDPAAARALFNALVAGAPGPVFLDLPESNPAAVALAREAGMASAFETARMYAGPAPTLRQERIFGVASFELG